MAEKSTALQVLFIGGIGRSGSTVFELSLGTDERVVALGEVIHLWRRSLLGGELCGCGESFSRCDFWQETGRVAFGGWDRVDATRVLDLRERLDRTVRTPQLTVGIGSAAWLADVREYASYYGRLYRAAASVSGRDVVVDSSKQPSLPYLLQYAEGLDVRVVHCVRDSRAVAYSWTKRVERPGAQTEDGQFMVRYHPAVSALKWLQHNAVVDALRLQRVPTMRVRYEDWAAQPVRTVESAMAFAGLDPQVNGRLGDEWVDLPVTHTCGGNPMRFTQGRLEIRKDEGWRTKLPQRARRLVTVISAPGLAAYGYLGRGR